MNLPEKFKVLVITLSDRAYRGEYEDLSGPAIKKRLTDFFAAEKWDSEIRVTLIPDDEEQLKDLVVKGGDKFDMIFTTGGTGIGPRDITVDVVTRLLTREIPGIMEFIRVKYGAGNPGALLSRGVAGITGKSLIYTLPGSLKAVNEYMTEILKTLEHTLFMQYGIDTHEKH